MFLGDGLVEIHVGHGIWQTVATQSPTGLEQAVDFGIPRLEGILPSVHERVATVLFIFRNSRQIRHMREPPRLGSRVRSPRGAVWTVAQVIDYGSDTYTATCVGRLGLPPCLIERPTL